MFKPANPAAWDCQPGESEAAHRAFLSYRDQGSDRSLDAVAQEIAKSVPLRKCWSAHWGWVERARAWEAHLQDERDRVALREARKAEETRLRLRAKKIDLAENLLDRVMELLEHPTVRKRGTTDGKSVIIEPAGWSQKDLPLMAKLASDLAATELTPPETDPTKTSPAWALVRALRESFARAFDN